MKRKLSGKPLVMRGGLKDRVLSRLDDITEGITDEIEAAELKVEAFRGAVEIGSKITADVKARMAVGMGPGVTLDEFEQKVADAAAARGREFKRGVTRKVLNTGQLRKHFDNGRFNPEASAQELRAAGKVGKILEPLSSKQRTEVLDAVNAMMGIDPDNPRHARGDESEKYAATLAEYVRSLRADTETDIVGLGAKMGPGLNRAALEWQALPGKPKTAANMDVLSMNVARFTSVQRDLMDEHKPEGMSDDDYTGALEIVARQSPATMRALNASVDFYNVFGDGHGEEVISEFHEKWFRSCFARLEVGHRLAAALCLTDVPDEIDVKAPWEAWSLILPDGLIGTRKVCRIWCIGAEGVIAVDEHGAVYDFKDVVDKKIGGPIANALRNLIRGACLALSNPDEFKRERAESQPSGGSKKRERSGPPDLVQARFVLSAPVRVDLREHLHQVLTGRKGASPTVQFLVRGFWRNQPYGPRNSLRRPTWIHPFWKGPGVRPERRGRGRDPLDPTARKVRAVPGREALRSHGQPVRDRYTPGG